MTTPDDQIKITDDSTMTDVVTCIMIMIIDVMLMTD
jgi:hypothetical protein